MEPLGGSQGKSCKTWFFMDPITPLRQKTLNSFGRSREHDTGDHDTGDYDTGDHERATDSGSRRPQGETTKGRPRAGYGFGTRETTRGGHKGRPGDHTGCHGQRLPDPSNHHAALEKLYRTLKLYSCLGKNWSSVGLFRAHLKLSSPRVLSTDTMFRSLGPPTIWRLDA